MNKKDAAEKMMVRSKSVISWCLNGLNLNIRITHIMLATEILNKRILLLSMYVIPKNAKKYNR